MDDTIPIYAFYLVSNTPEKLFTQTYPYKGRSKKFLEKCIQEPHCSLEIWPWDLTTRPNFWKLYQRGDQKVLKEGRDILRNLIYYKKVSLEDVL